MDEEKKGIKEKLLKIWKEKKVIVIALIIAILVIVAAAVILPKLTRTQANTTGNLRNYGFVAQKGSSVYYLKFEDGEPIGIYKVSKNGTKGDKVSSEYGFYLNVDGSYIYYIDSEDGHIMKMKTNGKNKETLVKNVDNVPITVYGGWIYYSKNDKFYRVKTNGKDSEKISSKDIDTYQIEGNWIYYTYYNSGEYSLSKMKLDGSDVDKIDSDVSNAFYVKGNKVYYVYGDYNTKNYTTEYSLYSMKTNGKDKKEIKVFDEDELYGTTYINMDKDGMYFISENDDGDKFISFMKYDGKEIKEIVELEGYATPIDVIGNWIYYTDYNDDDDTVTYKIKIDGKDKKEI